MTKRGKVLREPNSGPGLLMIDGQQFRFSVADMWRSEVPAKPGLNVDVELDHNLQITGITVIPDGQIQREHAQGEMAVEKDGKTGHKLIATFGALALIATAVLLVGWYFLRN